MVNVAVLGYGTIGSGVVEVLSKNKKIVKEHAGDEIRVTRVLDLREFPGSAIEKILTHDFNDIADDDSIDIEAAPNSELTLKVIASADEGVQLTYTWEKDYETIENANADTYTIASVTDEGDYSCTVSDQFGNSKTVYFYVGVETHLTAYPEGSEGG